MHSRRHHNTLRTVPRRGAQALKTGTKGQSKTKDGLVGKADPGLLNREDSRPLRLSGHSFNLLLAHPLLAFPQGRVLERWTT